MRYIETFIDGAPQQQVDEANDEESDVDADDEINNG